MSIAPDTLTTPEIFKIDRYLGNELGAKHKDFYTAKVRFLFIIKLILIIYFLNKFFIRTNLSKIYFIF